ncbi:hypothetical protein OWM54_42845 [Myxococcus sp. MISCRS1]|uniref:hypothetical protein n=1 Tax=Myxococcus sp. MISCRS1 TaxID=2996786 RepID=UPI00226E6315|nr:hypothetical protein [Myxococcus sp. MISCRS1]MCY1003903.1 hypothetical protein [Myxococcus sp. MISCRS1]
MLTAEISRTVEGGLYRVLDDGEVLEEGELSAGADWTSEGPLLVYLLRHRWRDLKPEACFVMGRSLSSAL